MAFTYLKNGDEIKMVSTDLALWVYAFFVISYFSQLYKDNPLYQFAEHIFIGVAAAHGLVMIYWSLNDMAIKPLIQGQYHWLFILLIGFLVLFRLIRGYRWVSNWPLAIGLGVGTGLAARGAIETQILVQITSTFKLMKLGTPLEILSNAIFIITVFCTVAYFLYTVKPLPSLQIMSKIGRWTLMSAFGTSMAWLWMSRLNFLISQLQKLLWEWLGIIF
jgi:hypothetical protein